MFNGISLRGRFLVAPIIGIILALILFFVNHVVIHSQTKVLRSLQETNLSRLSETSRFTVLLVSNHTKFSSLLFTAPSLLDEEQVYLQGRHILDEIYKYQDILLSRVINTENSEEQQTESSNHLAVAFKEYRDAVISAIELSSVDSKLAHQELTVANNKLEQLNAILLISSEKDIVNLSQKAGSISQSLAETDYIIPVTVLLIVLMIFSAYYFSHNLSKNLNKVIQALVMLAEGKTNVYLEMPSDAYLQELTNAVLEFKKTLFLLEEQKFALDQHSLVSITDVKGIITYANEKFTQISGYTRNELIGKDHRILNTDHHSFEFWRQMYRVIANGDVWQGEICNQTKYGDFYWVDTTIVPFKDYRGKPLSYISIRTDISSRKQAEEALVEAKELAESASTAKSEFISSMSHELRTPLNSIIGFSQLLLYDAESPLNSSQRENIEYVLSSSKYLLELINQILDLANIDRGNNTLTLRELDLVDIVNQVMELSSINAKKAGVELSIISDSSLSVNADPTKLRQILTNLIDNAIKYSDKAGSVTIAWTEIENNFVKITISDTGFGIAQDYQEHVFTAFNRLGRENSAILGTGIGLVITKNLVESMGGQIDFESAENIGSSFWFTLPLKLSCC